MTLYEILAVTVEELKPIFKAYIFIVAATLAAFVFCMILTKNITIDDPRFRVTSYFFRLSGLNAFFTACSWVKLVTLLVYLASFESLSIMHYFLFLYPGVLYLLQPGTIKRVYLSLGWLFLELAGLVSANLICRYYLEVSGRVIVLLIYIAAAIFVGAFGVLRFLYELDDISGTRRFRPEQDFIEE